MVFTYLPVSLRVRGRRCLVVGGGKVALRKVETLLDYDTEITVIAATVDEKFEYHARQGRIALEKREYRSPEAASYGFVISASNDRRLNRQVSEDCRNAGVLVNVVDDPALCDVIVPAVIRRDCLSVAIATDGRAPFMSGYLRLILENIFPEHWNRLMKLASDFRKNVQKRWSGQPEKKQACYGKFLEADWKSILDKANEDEISRALEGMLEV